MCSVGNWRDSRGSYYHPGPGKIGHENMTTKGDCRDFILFGLPPYSIMIPYRSSRAIQTMVKGTIV